MDSMLTPPDAIPSALAPLANSHEADAIEAAVKSIFMEVFEELLREKFNRVNLYGMAHRADDETVERFSKQDGIAIYRANSEAFLRELYRAWRGQNPRRGLEFLKLYLQLIFPNQWECHQMWQRTLGTYPYALLEDELPGASFLTSRVAVSIDSPSISESILLQKITPALRSVIAAKFVLLIRATNQFTGQLVIGSKAFSGNAAVYSGTAS